MLESELRGQLQAARSAAAEEGIANADVTSGGQAEGTRRGSVRIDAILGGVRDEVRQVGIREVRMVEDVVSLKAEFHVQLLGELRLLVNRKIELAEVRSDERVAALVAEVHGINTIRPNAGCSAVNTRTWVDQNAILR